MAGQNKKWILDKSVKTEYFAEQSVFIFKHFLRNCKNEVLNRSQFIELSIDFVQLGQSSFYESFTRVMTTTVGIMNVKQ
jgi:hypothetical protein